MSMETKIFQEEQASFKEQERENGLKKLIKTMVLALLAAALAVLNGCAAPLKRYQTAYLDLFDTVTSIVGYAASEEAFAEETGKIYQNLLRCHKLYDIYHEYEGMVNLCTLNRRAGEEMTVEPEIIALLEAGREICGKSDGRTDITLGAMLSIWHGAREAGIANPLHARLPDKESLQEAVAHRGFDRIEINPEKRTVKFLDPELKLDVGALAKGFAVEQAGKAAAPGYLISVGGNVYATGPKADGSPWTVGIQDPDGDGGTYLHRVSIKKGAVVTSGDYQRYFIADGKKYHHIIDPETCLPGEKWRAVTVISQDSGLADGLSTSLFLLSREEGQKLLEEYGAEAMWMDAQGIQYYSPGYEAWIQK